MAWRLVGAKPLSEPNLPGLLLIVPLGTNFTAWLCTDPPIVLVELIKSSNKRYVHFFTKQVELIFWFLSSIHLFHWREKSQSFTQLRRFLNHFVPTFGDSCLWWRPRLQKEVLVDSWYILPSMINSLSFDSHNIDITDAFHFKGFIMALYPLWWWNRNIPG